MNKRLYLLTDGCDIIDAKWMPEHEADYRNTGMEFSCGNEYGWSEYKFSI